MLYHTLLGTEPYVDSAYYVGFRVGEQEIGLDPNGHAKGMTGPIGYHQVSDIEKSLQSLLDAGAQVQQEIQKRRRGKADSMGKRRGRQHHRTDAGLMQR